MNRIGAIVQARLGSTRLPRKVLEPIGERSMLARVIERLSLATSLDGVVVAVPEGPESAPLVEEAERCGALTWCGPEMDVLTRTCGAAMAHGLDVIARITSDCPLIDPTLVDRVVGRFVELRSERIDLVANTMPRCWPRGLDTEVVSREALERVSALEKSMEIREHVTLGIYRRPDAFRTAGLEADRDLSDHRWTVDTVEDLVFMRAVYEALGARARAATTDEILGLLDREPQIAALNAAVRQKELPS